MPRNADREGDRSAGFGLLGNDLASNPLKSYHHTFTSAFEHELVPAFFSSLEGRASAPPFCGRWFGQSIRRAVLSARKRSKKIEPESLVPCSFAGTRSRETHMPAPVWKT